MGARLQVPARRLSLSYDSVGSLFAGGDAIIVVASSIGGGVGYHFLALDSLSSFEVELYFGIGLIASLAYAFVAWHLGLYRLSSLLQARRDFGQIGTAWLFVILVLAVVLFLFKLGSQISRGSTIAFVVIAIILLIGWRRYLKRRLKDALAAGLFRGRSAILVGTRNELATLAAGRILFDFGLNEVDRVILPDCLPSDFSTWRPIIVAVDDAIGRSRTSNAEEVLLALPWGNAAYLNTVRERLRVSPLPVRLLPDQFIRSIWDGDEPAGERRMLIDVQRGPLTRAEQLTKRIFDIVVVSAVLLMYLPLLLIVGALIKLETRGPIIFRQRRKGFNGQKFVIYKFRTMRVMEDGPVIAQARKHDPRVTKMGRLLRQSSIDELPQLLNVLKGDMSLVGPRPHAVTHDDQYKALIGNYAFRHHVKPGITGWAQVNGFRGETRSLEQMKKRVEFDLWYINNWSLLLDIQIVARTLVELMRRRNAY